MSHPNPSRVFSDRKCLGEGIQVGVLLISCPPDTNFVHRERNYHGSSNSKAHLGMAKAVLPDPYWSVALAKCNMWQSLARTHSVLFWHIFTRWDGFSLALRMLARNRFVLIQYIIFHRSTRPVSSTTALCSAIMDHPPLTFFAISFNWDNRLRLIQAPEGVIPSIRQVLGHLLKDARK